MRQGATPQDRLREILLQICLTALTPFRPISERFLCYTPTAPTLPPRLPSTLAPSIEIYTAFDKRFQKSLTPIVVILDQTHSWKPIFNKEILPPALQALQQEKPEIYTQLLANGILNSTTNNLTDLFDFIKLNKINFPFIVGLTLKLNDSNFITCRIKIKKKLNKYSFNIEILHLKDDEKSLNDFKKEFESVLNNRIKKYDSDSETKFSFISRPITSLLPIELEKPSTFLHPILLNNILNNNDIPDEIDLDQIKKFIQNCIEKIKISPEKTEELKSLTSSLYSFLITIEEFLLATTLAEEPPNNERLVAHYQDLSTYFFYSEQYILAIEQLEKAIAIQREIEGARYNTTNPSLPGEILSLWRLKKAHDLQIRFISKLDPTLLDTPTYSGPLDLELLGLLEYKIRNPNASSQAILKPLTSLVITDTQASDYKASLEAAFSQPSDKNNALLQSAITEKFSLPSPQLEDFINSLFSNEHSHSSITIEILSRLFNSNNEQPLSQKLFQLISQHTPIPALPVDALQKTIETAHKQRELLIADRISKIKIFIISELIKKKYTNLIQALITRGPLANKITLFLTTKYSDSTLLENDINFFIKSINSESLSPKIEEFFQRLNSNNAVSPFELKPFSRELERFIFEALKAQKETEELQYLIISTLKRYASDNKFNLHYAATDLLIPELATQYSHVNPDPKEFPEPFTLARDIALMPPTEAENDPHSQLEAYVVLSSKQTFNKHHRPSLRTIILDTLKIQSSLNRSSLQFTLLKELLRRYRNFLPFACERFKNLSELRSKLGINLTLDPHNPIPETPVSVAQLEFNRVFHDLLVSNNFNVTPHLVNLELATRLSSAPIKSALPNLFTLLVDPQRLISHTPHSSVTPRNGNGKKNVPPTNDSKKPTHPLLETLEKKGNQNYKQFSEVFSALNEFQEIVSNNTSNEQKGAILDIISDLFKLYSCYIELHFTALESAQKTLETLPTKVAFSTFHGVFDPKLVSTILPLDEDGSVIKATQDLSGKNTVNFVSGKETSDFGVYLKTHPDDAATDGILKALIGGMPGISPLITHLIRLTRSDGRESYTTTASGEVKGIGLDRLLSWNQIQTELLKIITQFNKTVFVSSPQNVYQNLIAHIKKQSKISDSELHSLHKKLQDTKFSLENILYIIRNISGLLLIHILSILTGDSLDQIKKHFQLENSPLYELKTKNAIQYYILNHLGNFLVSLLQQKNLTLSDLESLLITSILHNQNLVYEDVNITLASIFPHDALFQNPYSDVKITLLDTLIQIQTMIDPTLEHWINRRNFSALAVHAIESKPADEKPDNVIAYPPAHTATTIDREISLANDISTRQKIIRNPDGTETVKTNFYIESKTIFFLMQKLMLKPIDPDVRKYLINRDPAISMLDFLADAYKQAVEFDQLGGIHGWGKDLPDFLPFKFMPGTVREIYKKRIIAQHLLRTHEVVTHAELAYYTIPITFLYYYYIWEHSSENIMTDLSLLYSRTPPAIEQALAPLEQNLPSGLEVSAELKKHRRFEGYNDPADRTQTITEAIVELLKELDYEQLPSDTVYLILQRIQKFGFIQVLEFRHCPQLGQLFSSDPNTPIHSLATNLEQLKKITLLHCHLSYAHLCDLVSNRPNLELTISDDEILTLEEWIKIAKFTDSLTIILKNGVPVVLKSHDQDNINNIYYSSTNPVFAVLMNSPSVDALKFLAALGANFKEVDGRLNTILHLLTQKDYADTHPPETTTAIVEYLFTNKIGPDPNRFNSAHRTALMQVVATSNNDVVQLLMTNGAIPSLTTENNESVLHIAANLGNASALKIIIQYIVFQYIQPSIIKTPDEKLYLRIKNVDDNCLSPIPPMEIPITFETLPGVQFTEPFQVLSIQENLDLHMILESQDIPTPPIQVTLPIPSSIINAAFQNSLSQRRYPVVRVPKHSITGPRTAFLINMLSSNLGHLLSLLLKRNNSGHQPIHTGIHHLDVARVLHGSGAPINPPLAITHPGGETTAHLAGLLAKSEVLEYLLKFGDCELLLEWINTRGLTVRDEIKISSTNPDLLLRIPEASSPRKNFDNQVLTINSSLSTSNTPPSPIGQRKLPISVPQRSDLTSTNVSGNSLKRSSLMPTPASVRTRTTSSISNYGVLSNLPIEEAPLVLFELLTTSEKKAFMILNTALIKNQKDNFYMAIKICWLGMNCFSQRKSPSCESAYRYFMRHLIETEKKYCISNSFSINSRPKLITGNIEALAQLRKQTKFKPKKFDEFINSRNLIIADTLASSLRSDFLPSCNFEIIFFGKSFPRESFGIGIVFKTNDHEPVKTQLEKIMRYFIMKISMTFGETPSILSSEDGAFSSIGSGLCVNPNIYTVTLSKNTFLVIAPPQELLGMPLPVRLPIIYGTHRIMSRENTTGPSTFERKLKKLTNSGWLTAVGVESSLIRSLINSEILNLERQLFASKKIALNNLNSSFYSFLQLIIYFWGLSSKVNIFPNTLVTIEELEKTSAKTPLLESLETKKNELSTAATQAERAAETALKQANKASMSASRQSAPQSDHSELSKNATVLRENQRAISACIEGLTKELFSHVKEAVQALDKLKILAQLVVKSSTTYVYHKDLPGAFRTVLFSPNKTYYLTVEDFKNLKQVIQTIILLYIHFSTAFESFNLDTTKEIKSDYIYSQISYLNQVLGYFTLGDFQKAEEWLNRFHTKRTSEINPSSPPTSQFTRLQILLSMGMLRIDPDLSSFDKANQLPNSGLLETGLNHYFSGILNIRNGLFDKALEYLLRSEADLKPVAPHFILYIELLRLQIYSTLSQRKNIETTVSTIQTLLDNSSSNLTTLTRDTGRMSVVQDTAKNVKDVVLSKLHQSTVSVNKAETHLIYYSPEEIDFALRCLATALRYYSTENSIAHLRSHLNMTASLTTDLMLQINSYYAASRAFLEAYKHDHKIEYYYDALKSIHSAITIFDSGFGKQNGHFLLLLKFKAKIYFSILDTGLEIEKLFNTVSFLFHTLMLILKISLSLEEPHFEIWARAQIFLLSVQYNYTFKESMKLFPPNRELLGRDFSVLADPKSPDEWRDLIQNPNYRLPIEKTAQISPLSGSFYTSVFHLTETRRIMESLIHRLRFHRKENALKENSQQFISYSLMAKIYQYLAICNSNEKVFYLQNAYIIFKTLAQQAWLFAHHQFLPNEHTWFSPHELFIRKTINFLGSSVKIRSEINYSIDNTIATLRYMAVLAIYIRDFSLAKKIYAELHATENTQKYKIAPKQRHENSDLQEIELARLRFYELELEFLPHTDGLSYAMFGPTGMPIGLLQELEKSPNLVTEFLIPYKLNDIFGCLSAIQSDLSAANSLFKRFFPITTTEDNKARTEAQWNQAYLEIKIICANTFPILNRTHPILSTETGRIPMTTIGTLERITQSMGNNSRFMLWIYVFIHSMLEKQLLVPLKIPTSTMNISTLSSAYAAKHLLFTTPYIATSNSGVNNLTLSNYQITIEGNSAIVSFKTDSISLSMSVDRQPLGRMTWLSELTSNAKAVISQIDTQSFRITFETQTELLKLLKRLHAFSDDTFTALPDSTQPAFEF